MYTHSDMYHTVEMEYVTIRPSAASRDISRETTPVLLQLDKHSKQVTIQFLGYTVEIEILILSSHLQYQL